MPGPGTGPRPGGLETLVWEDLLHYVKTGAWCALSASKNNGPSLLLDHKSTMKCNPYSDVILNTALITRPV